jgi:ribosomal protein S18 acetylase RimI-like enzyme
MYEFDPRAYNSQVAISYVIPKEKGGLLRPLNILRDLPAVADLIELCFHTTMDSEGRGHIREMRRSANNPNFLKWAVHAVDSVSLPLSGFVWEDAGQVVGNVSLIPFNKNDQRIYLIANVATHPNYRNRGIARQLTASAMQAARAKNATAIWLNVRTDNPAAISVYKNLGFWDEAIRTQWRASASSAFPAMSPMGVQIIPRQNPDWKQQSEWMAHAYPERLNWYAKIDLKNFAPGIFNSAFRFLSDINMQHWSAYKGNDLLAVISMQSSYGQNNSLWLATHPALNDHEAIKLLLAYVRRKLSGYRTCSFEYPADECDSAIEDAGFIRTRTLVWMKAAGAT